MRKLSASAMLLLVIMVLSVYLPMLYSKLFIEHVEKTHLFFSPVSKKFIYKEKLVGPIPQESIEKAEDHHQGTAYRDQSGSWFSRIEFEKHLPFIYYKNMELWGLLPLEIDGRVLDKETIRSSRMVLSLKSGEIADRGPHTDLFPLFESNSGQVRLVFPEDRFRMTPDSMQFFNADTNREDPVLTRLFTSELLDKGFNFPSRSVNGKFTVLKPFDEGIFLVDDEYQVFHVKRQNGIPVVVKTPITPSLKTRYIKISENKGGKYLGLLLTENGELLVLTTDNYRLVQVPLENYDPDTMDFKMISNPLFITAIYSDQEIIRAVAMDNEYRPVDRFEHLMSRANVTTAKRIYDVLFPFSLQLEQDEGGYLYSRIQFGNPLSLLGLAASLTLLFVWRRIGTNKKPRPFCDILLVALCGIYGLIVLSVAGDE